jgi:predicted regulator of Ras-like GTPase activity (Roadblock/LC7/MglB family)
MQAFAIVEIQISTERGTRRADTVVGSQINLLVFDRTPQPLDEDVVASGAAAIHADGDRILQQQGSENPTAQLTALVNRVRS